MGMPFSEDMTIMYGLFHLVLYDLDFSFAGAEFIDVLYVSYFLLHLRAVSANSVCGTILMKRRKRSDKEVFATISLDIGQASNSNECKYFQNLTFRVKYQPRILFVISSFIAYFTEVALEDDHDSVKKFS